MIKKLRKLKLINKGYKYLGILEVDGVKDGDMKEKIAKEYYRRIRKILKSKLNGVNTITAINSRAVSIVRYGAGIIKWTKEDFQKMDRKTRKLLTVYRAFHPYGDVDRLYFKRSQGGRGLISLEDCVNVEVNSLRKYVESSDEKLLVLVGKENMLEEGEEKKEIQRLRRDKYSRKCFHGKFYTNTEEGKDCKTWDWLRRGNLKRETEGMLMAAQGQALRTKYIRKVIDKEDVAATCRLCGERDETVAHVVSECKMLAQKQYKNWRHDKIAQVIHWQLCKKYNMDYAEIVVRT